MKLLRIPYQKDEYRTFEAGRRIFNQGDAGKTMYVVHEGEVDLLVNGQLVEKVGPGGVLGEMGLIDASPRSATAVARTDCTLIPVNQARFTLLVQHTPDFALQLMRVMAARLRVMDRMLMERRRTDRRSAQRRNS
jgi:CRP/FNR family transcriptional regulator, cyclic AMP receptor protein